MRFGLFPWNIVPGKKHHYHLWMTFASRLIRMPFLCAFAAIFLSAHGIRSSAVSALPLPSDPWSPEQTVLAADFAKELQQKHDSSLQIIYVGVRTLYNGAHIPGAVFRGPGSTEQGIADLEKYLESLPKNSNVVLYCGCCPLDRCPNLRPAYSALRDHGFVRLRVLILPTSFAADWVERGYPIEKGQ
jgi:thiosulfate/3-mercaptopyruvate sulfurtransferase